MIAIYQFLEMSSTHPIPPPPGCNLDPFEDWLLATCDFLGWCLDLHGGSYQVWTLKKRLSNLPAGTPLTRSTLAQYYAASQPLKPGAKYGGCVVDTADLAIDAVENPRAPTL